VLKVTYHGSGALESSHSCSKKVSIIVRVHVPFYFGYWKQKCKIVEPSGF
jgi:hypothetical protein